MYNFISITALMETSYIVVPEIFNNNYILLV